ncbi:MAG: lytic transglycosylase domain-containing protein [Holophagales bacterium]|nr:lytic transglycosylase domain-containing protein [Holophagales bacterium]
MPGPEASLATARREAREGRPDPFDRFAGSGLFALRASLAREVVGVEGGKAPSAQTTLAASRIGLSDLGSWLVLEAEAGRIRPGGSAAPLVPRLLEFARGASFEPFARDALFSASRFARTPAEKRDVRLAWDAWTPRSPGTDRARIASALARSRLAATRAEAVALMTLLVRDLPGAPESAPDLFEPPDRSLFWEASTRGGPEVRLLRVAALAVRLPAAAADLAAPLATIPGYRLEASAFLLAGGHAKAAREALVRAPALAGRDEKERLRIETLLLASELRLLGEESPRPPARRPRGSRRPSRPPAAPGTPRPNAPEEIVAAWRVLGVRADALLARALEPPDRRRLLTEAVRAAARFGLHDEALRMLPALLSIDPSTTVGAEELFRSAFLRTLSRSPSALRAAADALQSQASLYRDVAVRRRATYWTARCLEALGRDVAARAQYASLVTTAVPDLYARWAGARLGVPVSAAPLPGETRPASPHLLHADAPSLRSRELLAVGLASLAEDAADAEGSADPFFLASAAAERYEFRRATALLKSRWPELGTPDEGGLPLAVRRAYYPFRQEALIVREAAANGLSPALVYGVIRQESLFQTAARSGAGATGLMQVMPGTGRYLLRQEKRSGRPDLKDPEVNVRLGARYLAMMLREFDGDPIAALAGYNAGPGRPRRWRTQAPGLAEDEFLEAMPLSEPRDYVKRVLFFEAAYAALHGIPLAPLPPAGGAVSGPP